MASRSVVVRLEAYTNNFNRKISESAVLTKQFAHELDSADGRMANMVQGALAIAPALVPIGAAGVPAVAGLAAQLGFATLGAGALVLGIHGVGDALDALNTFQLDPTDAHFKKLQQTMEKLGPAGGEFVLFLDHLQPRFRRLQALAEQGLLPGVEDGITHLLRLMPQVREMVFNLSSTGGDLIREAGNNLSDPRWQEFFNFLQTNARPTLTEMGKTAGNFALTFANLVTAFNPLERDFSQGLLNMSRRVREWSDGLEQSQGFQDLIDYVRTNGPKALDTLGAFADALVQIVEAGAPVGSVLLPAVTQILHVVAGIADSPAGPVLIGVAAAVGVLGRSLALLKVVGLRGEGDSVISRALNVKEIRGIPAEYRKVTAATNELRVAQEAAGAAAARARDAQFALVPDAQKRAAVLQYAAAQDRVTEAENKLATAQQRRSESIRQTALTAGKASALVAGLAVSQTGLADSTGLSNTASLALMGTIAGPWGTAIGAGTGLVLDLAHANDDLEHALKRVDTAANQLDFKTMRGGIADLKAQLRDAQKTTGPGDAVSDFLKDWAFSIGHPGGFAGARREGQVNKAIEDRSKQLATMRKNTADLFASLNGGNQGLQGASDDQLTAFITRISPALQRANVDIVQLLQHRSGWLQAQMAVHDWVTEMDSAQGRSAAVADALAQLNSQITPTADAAKQLSDALDALFAPEMNQAEALDRWISGLQSLNEELRKNKGGLEGNSQAALKNRAAIRDAASALLDRVKADANVPGADPKKLAQELRAGRDAIIQTAVAAGQSRGQVVRYLNTIGFTAQNLNSILGGVRTQLGQIGAGLRALRDKTVTIKIRQVMDAQANAVGSFQPGDVANRHMPELAGPGLTRVWREPETKGEAYIPLANDFRRPRAVDIWERTGIALGVQFRRYAFGGITGLAGGVGEVRLAQGDVDRIVRGLATIRPIADHITVRPHNYSEFLRQQEAVTRAAGIGGVPQ